MLYYILILLAIATRLGWDLLLVSLIAVYLTSSISAAVLKRVSDRKQLELEAQRYRELAPGWIEKQKFLDSIGVGVNDPNEGHIARAQTYLDGLTRRVREK